MTVNVYAKWGNKLSTELQLRTEEKWILDALDIVKKERNRLQIELLHLESLKAKQRSKDRDATIMKDSEPSTSTQTNHNNLDNPEELCNNEELNLMVSDYSTLKNTFMENNLEEEEEEEEEQDEEEDNCDNILLDMQMMMFDNKMP